MVYLIKIIFTYFCEYFVLRLIIKNSHLKMFYKFLTPILFNDLGNESHAPVLSYVSDLLSTFSSCFIIGVY